MLQKQLFKNVFTGLGLILIAAITAACFNKYYPLPEICKNGFEYLGYLCWVTSLGENGLTLLIWTQRSPAELLDRNLAKISYLIGVFTFVFGRELVIS
jgi:hypothetical protein